MAGATQVKTLCSSDENRKIETVLFTCSYALLALTNLSFDLPLIKPVKWAEWVALVVQQLLLKKLKWGRIYWNGFLLEISRQWTSSCQSGGESTQTPSGLTTAFISRVFGASGTLVDNHDGESNQHPSDYGESEPFARHARPCHCAVAPGTNMIESMIIVWSKSCMSFVELIAVLIWTQVLCCTRTGYLICKCLFCWLRCESAVSACPPGELFITQRVFVFVKTCTNQVQVVSDLNACWKIVLKCNHCKTWNAALATALLRCSGLRWVWSIALGSTILITLTFKLFYFRIRDCDDIFDLNEAGSATSMSLPVFVVQQMSTPMLTGESVPRRVTISSFRKFWMSRSRVFYILFLISCFI